MDAGRWCDLVKGFGRTFKRVAGKSDHLAKEAERRSHHNGATVLVVDDEDVVRALAMECLECQGFTVLGAADGREALEIYRAHGGGIACVLLDLTMPVMDGEECLRELRQIDAGAVCRNCGPRPS